MKTFLTVLSIIVLGGMTCGCFDLVVAKTSKIPERFPDYSKSIPAPAEIAVITKIELDPLTPEARKKVLDTVANLKAETAALREILNNYQSYAAQKN